MHLYVYFMYVYTYVHTYIEIYVCIEVCVYIYSDLRHTIYPYWTIHIYLISHLSMELIKNWKDGKKDSCPRGSFLKYLTLLTKTT